MAATDIAAVTATSAVTAVSFRFFDDLPRTARQRCEENPDIARLIYEFADDFCGLRRLARNVDDEIQTEIAEFLASISQAKRHAYSERALEDTDIGIDLIASIASRITSVAVVNKSTREIVLAFCDLLNDTIFGHHEVDHIMAIKRHFGVTGTANVWAFGSPLRLKKTAPRPLLEAFLANGFLRRFVPSALRSLPRDLFFDDDVPVERLIECGVADWRRIDLEDEPEVQYLTMWDTFVPSDDIDRFALTRLSQSVLLERNRLVLLLLRENIWTPHPDRPFWSVLEVTRGFPGAIQIELLDRLEHDPWDLFRERILGYGSNALFMCRSHRLHRETIMTWILDAGNLEHRLKLPYHVETRSIARQICQLLDYAAEVPWPVVRILVDSVLLEKDCWDRVSVAKYIVPKMPRDSAGDLKDHLQAVVDRHRATEGVIRRKVFHHGFTEDAHEWDLPVPPGFVKDCVSNFRRAMGWK